MAQNIANFNDRTIYDFKTRLIGGGARANLFECEINFPQDIPNLYENNQTEVTLDTRFLIKAAQLPGSTLNTIPVPFRGRTLKIAGDRQFEPWTITVMNDANFRLRNAFERWSNFINQHDDNAGVITPRLYQADMVVHQLSRGKVNSTDETRGGNPIPVLKSYKFYGCYPSAITPIPLSYDTTDSIEEFDVTFEVQWWDAFDAEGKGLFSTTENGAENGVPVGSVNLRQA